MTAEDVPTIHAFIRGLAIFEKLEADHVGTVEDLERTLFGPTQYSKVVIATIDGEPVGFALYSFYALTFLSMPGLYVGDLFVKKSARGNGVAKRLFAELAKIAIETKCARMEWYALDWNKNAIAFYKGIKAEEQDEWNMYRLTGKHLANLARHATKAKL
ncbi:hypothetical protein HK101_004966 [Irineochytrium annulatum]|nr:hypothetical protein HK101_004966 [Irineochytrium annulatum]